MRFRVTVKTKVPKQGLGSLGAMFFAGTSRFRPIRLLGSGGMGSVYLVHDQQLGTDVALKTLNVSSGTELYRFKREFRILADGKHPNLVTLYELISEGALWFFTMEYVAGLPFDRYLSGFREAVTSTDDHLTVGESQARTVQVDRDRLLQSVQQLCAGVQAIHEMGCVHRDLKPANVLVTPEGRVVILDFGLAELSGREGLSSVGGLSGTPAYMAPEQALHKSCLPAADWYAVGTMIYEVLTGTCPFEGTMFDVLLRKQTESPLAPTEVNPQADELISDLCMRMIDRDPSRRPNGAEILVRLGVTGDKPASPSIRRHTPLGLPAYHLLGREQELQQLYQAYAKARKGNLMMVIVEGSSGIGKTSLIETFLDSLPTAGHRSSAPVVLRGRCHERETLPFKALDSVVDGLSYHLASLDADDQAYVLPDGILYLCEIFPVLRHVKLTANERYFLPPLCDAKELRNQAFVAFCELVRHLARMQPVVVFIDDFQWVDRDSLTLLQALIQQPTVPGLLLVAGCRKARDSGSSMGAPLPYQLPDQPGTVTIKLGPLAPDNIRALVDDLLDADDVSPAARRTIAEAVVREANGNPFFSVEMVQHFRTVILPKGDLAGIHDSGDFRLEAMLLGRMGQLPKDSQRLLQIVALAGDPLPQRVLARAAELTLGSDSWERSLSPLIDECLVRRRGRQDTDMVEPFHDRIREVIAGSLDKETTHRLHVQLAQAVEQCEGERADMLARYWLSADDHERAKRYTCEAAAEARAKLAFDRAAELYQSAATLESDARARAELLRALGDCQAASGHPILAAKAYQDAAAVHASTESLQLHHLAAEQLLRGGHITQGLEVLQDVLKEAGLSLSSPRAAALSVAWRVVWLRVRGLRFKERPPFSVSADDKRLLDLYWSVNTGLGVVDTLRADDFLLRFLMLALKTGDIRRVSQGFAILGGQVAALGTGYSGWAMHLVSEAEVLARRSLNPATIGLARMSKAIARYVIGELNDAANELLAVEQYFLSHCHSISWELATTRTFACFSLRLAGRLRELCERFDRYTADADRTGDRYLATNLRTFTSIVWLIRDNVARARKDIEGCLDSWPRDMYQIQHFFYLDARCEQSIYAEQPAAALEAIRVETPRLRRSGLLKVEALRVQYLWTCGRAALAFAESTEESKRLPYLRQAQRSARRLSNGKTRAAKAIGTALSAAIRNLTPGADRGEVPVLLERAVAAAEATGSMLLAESARRWLGEAIGGRRGEEICARSNGWMADQGVQNPARLAHLIAPGFRRNATST